VGTGVRLRPRRADEVFMAWNYSHYIGKVAEAGKAEYPVPMYVNAWIVQPEDKGPGDYPSAGHRTTCTTSGGPAVRRSTCSRRTSTCRISPSWPPGTAGTGIRYSFRNRAEPRLAPPMRSSPSGSSRRSATRSWGSISRRGWSLQARDRRQPGDAHGDRGLPLPRPTAFWPSSAR